MRALPLLAVTAALAIPAPAAAATYAAYSLRYTQWVPTFASMTVDPGWHQIAEFGYAPNQDFGFDVRLLFSDTLEDFLVGFAGTLRFKYLAVRVERGSYAGRLEARSNQIMPFGVEAFDNQYLYIGLGLDTGVMWAEHEEATSGAIGLGYVQIGAPVLYRLAHGDPTFALDPDHVMHAAGFWVAIDNLKSIMRDQRENLWILHEGEDSLAAFGLVADGFAGVAFGVPGERLEEAVGRQLNRELDARFPPSFFMSFTLGTEVLYAHAIGPIRLGAAIGVEGRSHQAFAFSGRDEEPDGRTAFAGPSAGQLQFFAGPYGKVAVLW